MSGRVYLLGLLVVLVAVVFVATHALLWQPGVTEANARRIRAGISLAEAKAILGPHPHDDNPLATPLLRRTHWLGVGDSLGLTWKGPSGEAVVWVGNDNRVKSVEWLSHSPKPPPLARLRAWLGW